MDINNIVVTGTVAKEISSKYTKSGRALCHITLSCEVLNPFGYPNTVYIGVDGWNEVGEWMMENIEQGDQVLVQGFYNINSFDGTKGEKVYLHSVIAQNIKNLSNPVEDEVEEEPEPAPPPKKQYAKQPARKGAPNKYAKKTVVKPSAELDEDDIPFFGDDK